MDENQARAMIEGLTHEEKVMLYEMLSYLQRNRTPSESPKESNQEA